MKITGKIFIAMLCCMLGCIGTVSAQSTRTWSNNSYIKVNINTGNPKFPFPQFLEYKTGKSLAANNSEGVTHADMELTMREAYEIMSHRCRYDGDTHCGVPYITFNNFRKFGEREMPQGGAQFCTEGDGYMMLAAAIFADQATFNGLWMWIHDNRIPHRIRYQDGKERLPNYEFGGGLPICYALEGSTSENDGSATDGDDDIAMALLIAYKQWGEFMMQDGKPVLDYNGNPISYKEAAEDFLKSFVDTVSYWDGSYNGGHMSGNIGIDGYVKGGSKGRELSMWRNTQTTYPDISQECNISGGGGDGNTHTDYCAPAYYNEFAKWLESDDVDATDWQINQFKRAEASSDWLIGQAYEQGLISSIGTTNMSTDGKPVFSNFSEGEDFRTIWRMAQNYLWHGNPETSWNPVTHQVVEGGNTYEYDMALRMAEFMKEPLGRNSKKCEDLGASPDPGQPMWKGPALIQQSYMMNGSVQMAASSNYALGCASLAGVISGDLQLVADLYRHSELRWDDASTDCCTLNETDRYLMSMPKYFHGWFRCLGLLINSGNWHAPSDMNPAANMKVYMSVDKTYAYVDDKVTYTVQYRNYGSLDADDVKIETEIDPNYEVVSISGGGKFSDGKIVWDINSVPGFKTGKLAETIDSVSFTVIVKDTLNPRICLTSKISGSNFPSWVSNEYPNHATYTMERNCVDILGSRTLQLDKKASRTKMNPGDLVNFTVSFENKSLGESAYLNGGRDNVRLSYGNHIPSYGAWKFYQYYRFWNDADEAYINLENYRVSYYMNDASAIGLYDEADNPTGWTFRLDNGGDMEKYGWMPNGKETKFTHQKIPNGGDENGNWNQRLMIQFPGALMGSTTWVYEKLNHFDMLHKGGYGPCYFRTTLNSNPEVLLDDRVADDWSYSPDLQIKDLDGQKEIYTLISPCWANLKDPGYEVTSHARSVCSPLNQPNFSRVLVEEFDGYTWRRILGRGPLPGREAVNVLIVDTIPYELEWVGWIDSTALKNEAGEKVKAKYTPAANPKADGYTGIVKWTIPAMFVGEKDKLVYTCKARDLGCPDVDDTYYKNVAWISSETDSPDSAGVELMTTCVPLPPQPEAQDALFKRSSQKKAMEGDAISYEITFKNTVGTVVDADCKSTKGWTSLGGLSLGNVSSSGFELTGTHMYAPEKSYGKDGILTFSVENASNTTGIYMLFRYESGKPGDSNFKGLAIQLNINDSQNNNLGIRVYDNGKMIEEAMGSGKNTQFRGDYKTPTFKFKVLDDCLYMYCNDEDDEWTNVMKSWCDLKCVSPGYFGIYTKDNNGPPHMLKFMTELDYAFDIALSDSLPAELSGISNISDNGVYDASSHSIKWPTIATTVKDAMPYGDSIVYTFDAVVDKCDLFINNYANASVFGQKPIVTLNTVECGSSCELESVDLVLSDCACDSMKIKVLATKTGSYNYTLYKDDQVVKKNSTGSFDVKESGTYYAVVTSTTDDQCTAKSDPEIVEVVKTPEGEDFLIGPICVGSKAEDNANYAAALAAIKAFESQSVVVLWSDADGDPLTEMPNPDALAAGTYEYTYRLSLGCCSSEPYQFTFTKADTAEIKLSDLTICAGQSGTLSVEKVSGYSYLWSDGSTENELVTDQAGLYKVTVTTADGCLSTAQASIKVEDKLVVDLGKDTTICSANLPLVLDASSSYDTYLWNDNSTGSTLEVTASGEYEVTVTQGACDGGGKITVTVAESPVLEGTFDVSYMLSDTAANGQFDKSLTEYDASVLKKDPNFTYVWFDMDSKELSSEPIPSVTTDGTPEIFYVKAVNGNCESDLQKIKVQVISSPMPKAEDVNYCLNDEAQPLTAEAMNDGSGAVWTLTWYDADGNVLADAPKPSTAVAGETLYYVTQKDQNDVEGAKRKVTVTVYALPEVEAIEPIKKSCEEKILLNPLFTEKTGVAKYYMHYFDPEGENMYGMYNCIDCTEDVWATYSGTYNAWVYYYPITGLRCGSADKASIEVAIDTLKEFKVTASPSVCPFGEVEFSASASAGDAAVEYQWSGDAIGNEATLKVKDVDGIYGTTYSYKLNVIAGECQKDTTLTLTVGRGELTGALSANGQETKEFRTCGGEDIILSTTHEGSDFKWSTLDGTLLEESQTVTVTPSANTTYVLSFVNKCETSDTIKVEVLPISLTTDFSLLNTSVCEGEKASGTLTITGYDETMSGSYIKWFKDGVELPAFAGKSELSIESATTADAGTYTYEVSNGICLAKTTAGDEQAKLEVKPFVSFSMPDKVLAANGSSASLSLSDLIPSDAQVSWQGTVNSGSGNPFEIAEVTTSELFDIKVTADGYCERDTQLQLLVDAKVIVSASTTTPVVCQGDYVTLIADTTGTGLLLNPSDYKVTWYVAEEGGEFTSMQTSQLEIKNAPDTNVSYFAVVTYGDQVANSDTVPVTILSPLSYTKTVDTVSCSGAEIALNVTIDDDHGNAYEIKWEDGTTGSDLNVTPTVATDYAFTITQMDGLCPMTDKVHVSVKENPSIEMEDDVMICSGSSVTLDPTVSGDDIDSYAWVGPDGDTLDTSKKLTLEDASTGEYKLIVASASCGSASASQNVTVIPTPEVTIDSINFVTRRIVATGSSSSYEYKVDNGAWNTVDTFQSYIFDIPHTAFVRDDHGCEGLTLFMIIAPPVPIPEYFVPGSGSEHDSWDLTPIMDAYPTSTVKIYDRTGKVVAELDGDTADWDGTYNGHPLPSTDYWYVLNVPEIRKQFTGHFTLIRSK